MVASVHIVRFPTRSVVGAAVGGWRERPERRGVRGMRFARWCPTGALSALPLPVPDAVRWALVAFWDDDDALDRFLDRAPLARRWEGAAEVYALRLRPVRVSGSWSGGALIEGHGRHPGLDEPVAALTYGELRYRNAGRFWPANGRAAGEALEHDGLLAGVGLVYPFRTVMTFSLWRSLAAMQDFAYGDGAPRHAQAMRRMHDQDWHRAFLFARFVAERAEGTWDGRDPLGRVASAPDSDLLTAGQRGAAALV